MEQIENSSEQNNNKPIVLIQGAQVSKVGPTPLQTQKLEAGIDDIIERIIRGESFRKIAAHYQVGLTTFFFFRANSKHSADIEAAIRASAESFIEEAVETIESVQGSDSVASVMAAKEKVNLLKFIASKKDVKTYGANPIIPVTNDKKILEKDTFEDLVELARKKKAEMNKEQGLDENGFTNYEEVNT